MAALGLLVLCLLAHLPEVPAGGAGDRGQKALASSVWEAVYLEQTYGISPGRDPAATPPPGWSWQQDLAADKARLRREAARALAAEGCASVAAAVANYPCKASWLSFLADHNLLARAASPVAGAPVDVPRDIDIDGLCLGCRIDLPRLYRSLVLADVLNAEGGTRAAELAADEAAQRLGYAWPAFNRTALHQLAQEMPFKRACYSAWSVVRFLSDGSEASLPFLVEAGALAPALWRSLASDEPHKKRSVLMEGARLGGQMQTLRDAVNDPEGRPFLLVSRQAPCRRRNQLAS